MLLASLARAADLDTFEPAAGAFDGRGGPQLGSADVGQPGAASLGVVAGWETLPREEADWWTRGVALTVGGTWVPASNLSLELSLPVWVWLSSETTTGFGAGDLRLGSTVSLWNGPEIGVAIRPVLRLPTGSAAWGLGDGAPSADLRVAVNVHPSASWRLDLDGGVTARRAATWDGIELGSGLVGGAGLAILPVPSVSVGAELTAAQSLLSFPDSGETAVEAHGYASWRGEHVFALVGAGSALTPSPGSPDLRVFGSLAWHTDGRPRVLDADVDGIPDKDNLCATTAEDWDGFRDTDGCPEVDNDGDGIVDADDGCRDVPEDIDSHQDADGCPEPDDDADGVLDVDDDCPEAPGTPAALGCPDQDGDGVADTQDGCPAVPGPVADAGCPRADEPAPTPAPTPARPEAARSSIARPDERVDIHDPVLFEAGTAKLLRASDPVLAGVARALTVRPEIHLVEVAGHTDNDGADAANLALSQSRAQAVVEWLVAHGIARERLVAKGYGETRPIDTNATAYGRSRNRRVEFIIRK